MSLINRTTPLLLLFTSACGDVEDHDHDHDHNHGLLTALVLSFTPTGGGEVLSFTWSDPEDDGDPVVDDIVIPDASEGDHVAQEYTVDVMVLNELEDPPEDVTPEIAAEDDEHQLFFTGSAVEGPATGDNPGAVIEHAYADTDADGLPLGLSNTVTTLGLGSGELVVTLRHMPPEGDEPVKVDGLAQDVADGGFGAIGGENDIQVSFNLEVE